MHVCSDDQPYSSATNAMKAWSETATAILVRLGKHDAIEVAAPIGLDDLFNLIVRPTAKSR
ncbi:nucleotidyltransferase family protein [Pseudomonas syringae]|uniref:nucleotidyltransferase family protein n=1 Tax=Pseudomonas syringae TaxID=317 RepID=UPI001F2B8A0E|nr:nucleotidyltransferase family protein [Pseudomonas syringae]